MTKKQFKELSILQIDQLNYGINRFGYQEMVLLCVTSGLMSLYPIKCIGGSFCLDDSRVDLCFEFCKNKDIEIIKI